MVNKIPFKQNNKYPSQINIRVPEEIKLMERLLKGRGVKTSEYLREIIIEALKECERLTKKEN